MRDLDDVRMAAMSDHDRRIFQQVRQQEEISHAGRELRKLRTTAGDRTRKRYTGYLSARRKGWIGQKVILPSKAIGEVMTVHRGVAAISWNDPLAVSPRKLVVLDVASVQPFRQPCAVALGRLKAGRSERPTAAKVAAARSNGRRPVKPGSRPRGRPKKNTRAHQPEVA